jgi:hypothetical protein
MTARGDDMVDDKMIDELREIFERHEAYMYGECERCKSGGKNARGHRNVLCGEFVTKICDSCVRDWDAFCDRSVEYKEFVFADYEKKAVKALIKAGQDLRRDLITAVGGAMKAKTAMYSLAESWVKRTRER